MTIDRVYAQLKCSDLEGSVGWFRLLFGRAPDARPMDGLAEWHHKEAAGLQLFEDASGAGQGTLTLIVTGLEQEHSRLSDGGLEPGDVERADTVNLVRLRDPDGNLVVLAEPRRSPAA